MDDVPGLEMAVSALPCGHGSSFCLRCVRAMAAVHIAEGQVEMVRCPDTSCKVCALCPLDCVSVYGSV